jgi:protein SCO1/2
MSIITKKLIVVLLLLFALILGISTYINVNHSNTTAPKYTLGGDFNIPTADGLFKLADYTNKVVVLYFGYASCPDVCPTALALVGNILKTLPTATREQIQPLFISVDPTRDTLDKLKTYGHYFYPTMLSGTADRQQLDILVKKYGAYYKINQQTESAMGYTVDHTSRIYLIDKEGLLSDTIAHADIQNNLAKKVLQLTE